MARRVIGAAAAVCVCVCVNARVAAAQCAPLQCLPAAMLPRGGDVPYNLPALAVVPQRAAADGSNATVIGAAVLQLLDVTAADDAPAVVLNTSLAPHLFPVSDAFSVVAGAASGSQPAPANDSTAAPPQLVAVVLLPPGTLRAGRTYRLQVSNVCGAAEAAAAASVTFHAIHWSELPEGLGRLTVGDVRRAPLMLPLPSVETADGSCAPAVGAACARPVPAAFRSLSLEVGSLAAPWAAALWLRPVVDGRPWAHRPSSNAPPDVFGPFTTLLFKPCLGDAPAEADDGAAAAAAADAAATPNCSARLHHATAAMGAAAALPLHTLEWRAWLPGTNLLLHASLHRVPLPCTDD